MFLNIKHIYKNIDKNKEVFGGVKRNRKKNKWKTLRKNKNDEGLGFRDLHSYNKTLLAKQAWRILNNPNDL